MDMPTPPRGLKSVEGQFRRARDWVTPYAVAVWNHLRVHWTDAILFFGFVAVGLLTGYLLLKS
jgi:hypothetical protein